MTDFAELSRQLIGITASNSLLKAKDIFADNGTLYVVYEDVSGVTLTRYLMDNAGELSCAPHVGMNFFFTKKWVGGRSTTKEVSARQGVTSLYRLDPITPKLRVPRGFNPLGGARGTARSARLKSTMIGPW